MDEEIKFRPLSEVLAEKFRTWGADSLNRPRVEFAEYTNSKLMNQLTTSFEEGSRTHAFLISTELTRRGIPPYLRSLSRPLPEYNDSDVNRRFDLLIYDLQWIVATYPNHKTVAPRYMEIYKHGSVHKGAEHIAKRGNREIWEITRDMGLSVEQQWDCHAIRGREVMSERRNIRERRLAYLDHFKREAAHDKDSRTDDEKDATRQRRFNIWICSCIAGRDKPSEIARRYEQLTGESIDRRVVARQLKLIPAKLRPTQI